MLQTRQLHRLAQALNGAPTSYEVNLTATAFAEPRSNFRRNPPFAFRDRVEKRFTQLGFFLGRGFRATGWKA